jgi:formylglycine-generating enzyme required for sulfatase activity
MTMLRDDLNSDLSVAKDRTGEFPFQKLCSDGHGRTPPANAFTPNGYDACQPNIKIPRRVLKGGSHLCAPNYCRRFRPAARHAEAVDRSTSRISLCVEREARNDFIL